MQQAMLSMVNKHGSATIIVIYYVESYVASHVKLIFIKLQILLNQQTNVHILLNQHVNQKRNMARILGNLPFI